MFIKVYFNMFIFYILLIVVFSFRFSLMRISDINKNISYFKLFLTIDEHLSETKGIRITASITVTKVQSS